ncbi:unnamed protein product [Adineta steineri]|uniref:Uncharacterized protein n=1 Tax=Adineta steineri TaxID=433720 RepID=A0A814CK63_9BILA|nr:unnamed protein product [Adineta steineri]
MTVTPHFHQLCSSDFVRDDRWLLYFQTQASVNTTNTFTFYAGDFRGGAGSSLFYLIQTLCETAKTTVINAAAVFSATKLEAPIDPRGANTTALNPDLPSRFLPNSTFEPLVSNMFIENWTLSDNYSTYYTICNPDSCTYTYDQRYALVAAITVLIAFGIIIFFTTFTQQTRTITVLSPSQTTFSHLQDQQKSSLSCLCSEASIQYDVFLSISPRLHQVCSSDFVVEQWWSFLWGIDAVSNFRDLQLLSIQFRVLASLCSLAQQSIDNDASEFLSNKLVTIEAMSLSSFQAQIDSLTATFIVQTPNKFRRIQSFIYEIFRANQLLVVPETNWQLAFTTAADNYVVATVPRVSFGTNYSCITSLSRFSRPLYIDANYNTTVLPGVVAGCLPIDGIRLSTLECFFDPNCIFNLASIASTRTTTIWIARPLSASIPSIYPSNTHIGNLVDSLFVEDWGIKSNYSSYFASCAPNSCSYKYIDHNTILYIITTVLGLYGGLTVALSFIVWRGWRMCQKILRSMEVSPYPPSTRVVLSQPTIHIE